MAYDPIQIFTRLSLYSLGGNRKGPVRQNINLLVTMLLGGLWHGASWSFVFWGCLHGSFLVVNHAFQTLVKKHFKGVNTNYLLVFLGWLLNLFTGCCRLGLFSATSFQVQYEFWNQWESPSWHILSIPSTHSYGTRVCILKSACYLHFARSHSIFSAQQ